MLYLCTQVKCSTCNICMNIKQVYFVLETEAAQETVLYADWILRSHVFHQWQ